jgi:hypothetical protein
MITGGRRRNGRRETRHVVVFGRKELRTTRRRRERRLETTKPTARVTSIASRRLAHPNYWAPTNCPTPGTVRSTSPISRARSCLYMYAYTYTHTHARRMYMFVCVRLPGLPCLLIANGSPTRSENKT